MLHSGDLDFSFSGLKTAVLTAVQGAARWTSRRAPTSRAASSDAIVDVLVAKSLRALEATGPATRWWSPAASAPTGNCAKRLDAAAQRRGLTRVLSRP